jgi:hypothetical protein
MSYKNKLDKNKFQATKDHDKYVVEWAHILPSPRTTIL